jgi:hypothetical protein
LFFIQLFTMAKVAYYRNVVNSMTGNTAFTTPTPPLADVTTQVDLVEDKATAAAEARTALTLAEAELQQEVDNLDTMGRALAGYVEGASMGNSVILESSGFSLTAPRTPVGTLPAPSNLRALPGQEGTCLLKWNRDRGATSWTAQCAPQATGPWTQIYNGTRSQCVATGLTSGTQYWFRVQALGSAGPSDWSDPTTKRAS